MPITTTTPQEPITVVSPGVVPRPEPSGLEMLGAAFRLENTVTSYLSRGEMPAQRITNPDFVFRPEMVAGYEEWADRFKWVDSEEDLALVKSQIQRELHDRDVLARSGAWGFAAMFAAGLLDPLVLLPVGGVAVKGARTTQSLLRTGYLSARAGALGAAATEAVLHPSQETRTLEESLMAVSASTVLSGMLGGGVAAIGKTKARVWAKDLETSDLVLPEPEPRGDLYDLGSVRLEPGELAEDVGSLALPEYAGRADAMRQIEADADALLVSPRDPWNPDPSPQSIQRYREFGDIIDGETLPDVVRAERTLSEEKVAKAFGFEKLVAPVQSQYKLGLNPMLRVALKSESYAARVAMQNLVETPFYYTKNADFNPSYQSVYRMARLWEANHGRASRGLNAIFSEMRLEGPQEGAVRMRRTGIQARDLLMRGDDEMAWPEFKARVSRALRRGDEDPLGNEYVTRAAKQLREEIFQPMLEAADEVGLLSKDLQTRGAETYLTRIWNKAMIQRRPTEFQAILATWIRELDPSLSAGEIEDIANAVKDELLGHTARRLFYEPFHPDGRTGPLRGRNLLIPDTYSVPDHPGLTIEDFLEDDIEEILDYYVRALAPDIEMQRKFGSLTMEREFALVNAEYNSKIRDVDITLKQKKGESSKAWNARVEKERVRLDQQKSAAIADLEAMRDLVRHQYGIPEDPDAFYVRGSRFIKNMNMISKSGGFVISALPDSGMVVLTSGFNRTFRVAVRNFLRNQNSLDAVRVAREEIQLAGEAWDLTLGGRAESLYDIGDPYARQGFKVERGAQAFASRMPRITGLSAYDQQMTLFAGTVRQSQILDIATRLADGRRVSKAKKAMLAQLGLDEAAAVRIAEQFNEHGQKAGSVYAANTVTWQDARAVRDFRAAIGKAVKQTILDVNPGQTPLTFHNWLGGLLFQWKSFGVAATQKLTMNSLQRVRMGDPAEILAVMGGYSFLVAGGMMAYAIKTKLAGREITDDPLVLVQEGIDRSGIMGHMADMNAILESLTSGNVGMSRMFSPAPLSRYSYFGGPTAALGPWWGTVSDTYRVGRAAATLPFGREVNEGDMRAARRLMPLQNFWALRTIEEAFTEDEPTGPWR